MSTEVLKVSNLIFLSAADNTLLKKIVNQDFKINENFADNDSKITFATVPEKVDDGVLVKTNQSVVQLLPVKVYLAKYRKYDCTWENVIYYETLEDVSSVELNKWEFFYSNDKYSVFRIFANSLPNSLPLNGELPAVKDAPFIRYEIYKNIWIKKEGKFKYEKPILSMGTVKGDDKWTLISSSDTESEYQYISSLPYGCVENTVQTNEDVTVIESSSSSLSSNSDALSSPSEQSSSSTSSNQIISANSSSSSESDSSESSTLNSSSSEERRSPKNISTLYLRMVGEPFTENQYVLRLVSPSANPLEWTATVHDSSTLTTGTISLKMNYYGRFLLSMTVVVDGNSIVISNALISNIKNDNFAYYNSYLKALAPIQSWFITTKYSDVDSYDCILSYESLKRNNGENKTLNEIIYDYELAEITPDKNTEKINVYIDRACLDEDKQANDICRGWGFFCLNNNWDNTWSYSSDMESIVLEKSNSGQWNLIRRYATSSNAIEEIELPIDYQDVTIDSVGEYNGFSGISVVARGNIKGGPEESNALDICNDKETLVTFFSSDNCGQDLTYFPYAGNLVVTLSGGNWSGKNIYQLKEKNINSNLSVWNWSSQSSINYHEYATLFSQDGILWKLNIGRLYNGSRSYIFKEFIFENKNASVFTTVFEKIDKSLVSIDGSWASSEMTLTISSE